MSGFSKLWVKLAKSKRYREEFVAAQVKRGLPFQIRTMLKKSGISQEDLAARAGLTQGVVSRAANPEYGNLTINTIIRIAAGFDVAFVGKLVPFSELAKWFVDLSEDSLQVKSFEEENKDAAIWKAEEAPIVGSATTAIAAKIEAFTAPSFEKEPNVGSFSPGKRRRRIRGNNRRRRPKSEQSYAGESKTNNISASAPLRLALAS
jgi:transcriptional regulator with XRE-family HTH domain